MLLFLDDDDSDISTTAGFISAATTKKVILWVLVPHCLSSHFSQALCHGILLRPARAAAGHLLLAPCHGILHLAAAAHHPALCLGILRPAVTDSHPAPRHGVRHFAVVGRLCQRYPQAPASWSQAMPYLLATITATADTNIVQIDK